MNDILKNLKPCPFCGRKIDEAVSTVTVGVISKLTIHCDCGVNFEIGVTNYIYEYDRIIFTGETAIDKWNRREEVKEE